MNQEIHWGKIATLVVVIVGISSIAFVAGRKMGEPVANTTAPTDQQLSRDELKVASAGQQKTVYYENKKYGFSLNFPVGWSGYKALDGDDSRVITEFQNTEDRKSVLIFLPTTEDGWARFTEDPSFNKYALAVSIEMYPKREFDEGQYLVCNAGPDPSCISGLEIGRTEKYAVIMRKAPDMPQDTTFQNNWSSSQSFSDIDDSIWHVHFSRESFRRL